MRFRPKQTLGLYTLPCAPFDMYGLLTDKKHGFVRMPVDVSEKVSKDVKRLNLCTAGGRVRFATDAKKITLYVTYPNVVVMHNMSLCGSSAFVLSEETEHGRRFVKTFSFGMRANRYQKFHILSADLPTDGKMHDYILYFPTYNPVKKLSLSFSRGATVTGGKKYRDIAPVLYYGSSITQGGCASRADNAYQALIEKKNNVDFINLGFSGSCKAEPDMVDYLTTVDCSLFVCDFDHNMDSAEQLSAVHFPLYQRYRAVRKDTPILFITRPDFDSDPASPARRAVVKATYEKARALGDKNVYFLDGETLFGKEDRENCFVDGCHPNDLGFYRMAQAVYAAMVAVHPVFSK